MKLLPKIKLEIAINDAFVEAAVEAIIHAARSDDTGKIGDGKIFVLPLEDCIRIRTGNGAAPPSDPEKHPNHRSPRTPRRHNTEQKRTQERHNQEMQNSAMSMV